MGNPTGNPLQTIPNLPPAIAVSGAEQVWINQAGTDRRATLAMIAALAAGTAGGAGTVGNYASLRTSTFGPSVSSVFLNDPYKGGIFVRGPPSTDNGGTRINDSTGTTWYRLYDERINAAWFYDAPPDVNGNPTTLGSGTITITAADQAANAQNWVGLADDGGVGVQTAIPYPLGTYWDFVALQQWIYACAAARSVPQSTFVASMANGQMTVSQWLTGPQALAIGQPITGPGVAPGTYVVATTSNPNIYWIGQASPTASSAVIGPFTSNKGSIFSGFQNFTSVQIVSSWQKDPPIQIGDQIISPLGNGHNFAGVLPGTVFANQLSTSEPDGSLGRLGTYTVAVAQTVPSAQMLGVGGPNWNTNGGNTRLNEPGFCPVGTLYLNQMLVCNGDGLDLLFASRLATTLNWRGNATGTSPVGPAVKFNTLDYSEVANLNVNDQSTGVTNYLVSISHTGGANDPGLNVQNNAFREWFIGGNGSTSQCGVAVSPEGGAAQGDTQWFYGIMCTGFNQGITFGGANAIAGTFFGGQTLTCPQYGVAAFGGSWSSYTMLCENSVLNYYAAPQRSQIHLGGCDFYASQVTSESCVCIGTRSESVVGVVDLNHESTVLNWTCGGGFQSWAPNAHWTPQTILNVRDPFGAVLPNMSIALMADDGGPAWFQGTLDDATGKIITVNPAFSGGIAGNTLTVTPPPATGILGVGYVVSGPGVAANTTITKVLSPAGTYTLSGAAQTVPPGTAMTATPGWTANQWAGFGIWARSGVNAASNVIVSNDDHTLTLSVANSSIGPVWWKLFGSSGGAQPNWGATTHFGVTPRNANGAAVTMALGFNLFYTGTALTAGDWVMVTNGGIFPDGVGTTMALVGKAQNQHPASSGWYYYQPPASFQTPPADTMTVWGTPTNPILAGAPVGINYVLSAPAGGGAGQYGMAFNLPVGSQFSGRILGNLLEVDSVAWGTIGANQFIGGAGIGTAPAPKITNAGPGFIGYVDDGTGGTTAGNVLTVSSVIAGVIRPGAPLTGARIAPGTIILSQTSGPAGGAGVYAVSGVAQLSGQCTFTGSINPTGSLVVSAVASGALVPGMLLQGPTLPGGVTLGLQISGTKGGIGSYGVSQAFNPAQAVTSASWQLSAGGQAAQFTASIDNGAGATPPVAGNVMNVSAISNPGVLGVGMTVNVPVTGGPAGMTQQLTISALDTGTGGVGTYILSNVSLVLPPTALTANTGNGIGVYTLDTNFGAPIAPEAMWTGAAGTTPPLWELIDAWGNPQNAARYMNDQLGYYSADIPDGSLHWMIIDYDAMWGVGYMDQCQLPSGKVGSISKLGTTGLPAGTTQNANGFASQFIRPGEGYIGQFAYQNNVTFTAPPRFGTLVNATPFTLPLSAFGQHNVTAQVSQNTTLGMAPMGPGMAADIDVFLTCNAVVAGGMIITWDTTTVKAAAPTLNIGANGQTTIVRMKWFGSGQVTGSPGFWWVAGVQGPMT